LNVNNIVHIKEFIDFMKIRWGNVFILLLIIAAGVMAFNYKYPDSLSFLNRDKQNNQNISNNTQDKSNEGTSNTNSTQGKIIMGLDSWIGGTPIVLGLSREYNRDYSLSLDIEYIPNDEDRIAALKAGDIQFTEMSLPSFIRLQDKNPNSGVIIGITDFSTGADGIIAKSEIKTLNDMDGKRVSYVGDGTGKFLLNKFLRLTGLRYQDIKPIEKDEMSDVIDDLKSGKADLAVSWSPDMNIAVKEINASKPGSVKLLITTKEVPTLIPTVLVANKQFLEKNPEKVAAFLKTWYASVKYIIERSDKAYEKLSSLMAEQKDIYGAVTQAEVTESFSNIKLVPLNDTFDYFGVNLRTKSWH
jgi:NitT/TauT family transport system substrate-binding protein